MQFYTSHFFSLLSTFIFVMARLSGAFLTIPFLSNQTVNSRTKAAFIFILSFIVVPSVQPLNIDLLSFTAALTVAVQIILGAILGFVFYLSVQVFMLTGEIISMQAGLNMAVMNDPISNNSVPIISQIYYLIVTLLFFVLDIHLQIIEVLCKSFQTLPLSTHLVPSVNFEELALLGDFFYKMAFQIALPVVTILFLAQIAMGVMSKSAPQFNIFSVGFAITILLTMLTVWLNISNIQAHFESIMHFAFNLVTTIYGGSV
jgi:flagellar biosynthetic protein FliR